MKKQDLLNIYDRNTWIAHVPWLGGFFHDLKNAHLNKKSRTRIDNFLNNIHFFRNFHRLAPRKYLGGVVLNILGFQIYRMIFHHLSWKLRQLTTKDVPIALEEYRKTMERDGVIVISDIFSDSEVETLIKDFDEREKRFVAHFEEFQEGMILPTNSIRPGMEVIGSDFAEKKIQANEKINSLIESLTGHSLRLKPEVTYLKYTAKLTDLGKMQVDGQDRLHSDVVYPSLKVFIYANDTTAANGAFIYCPGSHKLTWNRIWLEYKISVRYFSELRKGAYKPTEMSAEEKKFLNLNERSMEGKAGSVILFNTMGFHRRGDFTDPAKPYRKVVLSNYRYLDSFANKIGWKAF